uniref:Post-GPI attachment to proteins factor 2 n=1 Tax=Romanomermis culicivorax TaxID=13658 RepID=A0A915KCE0_ROMCU
MQVKIEEFCSGNDICRSGFDQLCSKLWKKSFISTSSPKIILRNSFFIWLTPAVAYFVYTFYDASNLEKLSCYCQASTAIPNTFIYQFVSYFVISVQITTCFIYAAVYHLNRKHFDDFGGGGRSDQGLSTRYNVWSNIQATKWLLPVAIFHSILSASIIFMSIMNNALKFMSSPVDFLQFSWAVYLLFSFDRFMHPILAVR